MKYFMSTGLTETQAVIQTQTGKRRTVFTIAEFIEVGENRAFMCRKNIR